MLDLIRNPSWWQAMSLACLPVIVALAVVWRVVRQARRDERLARYLRRIP